MTLSAWVPDKRPHSLLRTPQQTRYHISSEEMPQTYNEPAHGYHRILMSPSIKLAVCPLGTGKEHNSDSLRLVHYFHQPL